MNAIHRRHGRQSRLPRVLSRALCVSCVLAGPAAAQTLTISDGEFAASDWDAQIVSTAGPGGSFTATQELTGGNPGSHRLVDHTVLAPGASTSTTIKIFHRYTAAICDPAIDGPIASIVMRIDTLYFNPPFPGTVGQGVTTAIQQAGVVYIGPGVTTPDLTWTTRSISAATSQLFVEVGGTRVPDFGSSGAPIEVEFDFLRASDTTVYDCVPAVPNSTGHPRSTYATGGVTALNGSLTLTATGLPQQSTVFFLASRTPGVVVGAGGSQGDLCLGGSIGRYVGPGQVGNSGVQGTFSLGIDLAQMPTPTGLVIGTPGETWYFQAWHRDANPSVTSNFTNALHVTLQ